MAIDSSALAAILLELFSVIPKGDSRKPDTRKAHPWGEPLGG